MKYLMPALSILALSACRHTESPRLVLNDVHSRLNATEVAEYHEPATKDEIVALVRRAARLGRSVSISGGRHAMGGQQFGRETLHINLIRYNRILHLDAERGLVIMESGVCWPDLIDWLDTAQRGGSKFWGIRQKPTGADRLSLGGALSSNIHGRGLTLKPIVGDVESFELIDGSGNLHRCGRRENLELFRLVIGGYGLFGVITEITLRLSPRTRLERKTELVRLGDLPDLIERRIRDGFVYGDYQFKTDERAEDFLEIGIFSCYRPAREDAQIPEHPKTLSAEQWKELYRLAHVDKAAAFEKYAEHYLATDGQVYWSDSHQLSYYVGGLDESIDREMNARAPGSLMITELYVPRPRLPEFLRSAGAFLQDRKANLIYGTVRWIEKDDETFLPWARERFACIVMNLRVIHDEEGIEAARGIFQGLIDIALSMDGSYYLTYHRWARKDQVLRAYPRFPEFLRAKRRLDPDSRFESDWFRHYRRMFSK